MTTRWNRLLHRWTSVLLGSGLIAVLIGSFAGYLGRFHYGLDLLAHFKVQYLSVAVAALVFFGLKRQPAWIALSLSGVLLNLAVILPWYFPIAPAQAAQAAQPAQTLRVLTANVQVKNRNTAPLLALIRRENPDLVAVIETNRQWLQDLQAIESTFPYSVQSRNAEGFGVALYSKYPLTADVVATPTQSVFDFVVATVQTPNKSVAVMAVHPPPPIRPPLFKERNQQLQLFNRYAQRTKLPIVLMGDLNITPWSPLYQQFARTANLRNSRQGFGILPTWSTKLSPLMIPIDHCMVSPEIRVTATRRGPAIGSDHLPLIVDLAY